jgi:hypothetical protein
MLNSAKVKLDKSVFGESGKPIIGNIKVENSFPKTQIHKKKSNIFP